MVFFLVLLQLLQNDFRSRKNELLSRAYHAFVEEVLCSYRLDAKLIRKTKVKDVIALHYRIYICTVENRVMITDLFEEKEKLLDATF